MCARGRVFKGCVAAAAATTISQPSRELGCCVGHDPTATKAVKCSDRCGQGIAKQAATCVFVFVFCVITYW